MKKAVLQGFVLLTLTAAFLVSSKPAQAAIVCDNTQFPPNYYVASRFVARNDGSCYVYGGSLGSIGHIRSMTLATDYVGSLTLDAWDTFSNIPCASYTYSQTFSVASGTNLLPVDFDFTPATNTCGLRFTPTGPPGAGFEVNAAAWPAWMLYDTGSPANPTIDSFTLSTSTGTLRVTGTFTFASPDPGNSQALYVYRSDVISGVQPLDFPTGNPIFATTTGPFDFTFTGAGFTAISGPDFGQYTYQATTTFTGELQQWQDSVPTTLVSTSTSYVGTSTQITVGVGIGTWNTLGTTTLPDTTNLLSFLNVPYLLATKVPFGYFFEAKDAIVQGVTGSSTSSVPSGTFTVRNIGGPGRDLTVDMFSTSTVGYFLSQSNINLLRGLMVTILLAEFVYLLYRRGKSTHLI